MSMHLPTCKSLELVKIRDTLLKIVSEVQLRTRLLTAAQYGLICRHIVADISPIIVEASQEGRCTLPSDQDPMDLSATCQSCGNPLHLLDSQPERVASGRGSKTSS